MFRIDQSELLKQVAIICPNITSIIMQQLDSKSIAIINQMDLVETIYLRDYEGSVQFSDLVKKGITLDRVKWLFVFYVSLIEETQN